MIKATYIDHIGNDGIDAQKRLNKLAEEHDNDTD